MSLPTSTPYSIVTLTALFLATKWFLGTGHSISSILEYLADPANPDPKTILDGLFKDSNNNEVPALMMEATSHSVWVNSAALKLVLFLYIIIDLKN